MFFTAPIHIAQTSMTNMTDLTAFETFHELYKRKDSAITLMHQLNGLVKAVQKHRGISMGLIGGNRVFEGDFSVLQAQFERRLATLEVFTKDSKLLTDKDKSNLHQAWTTISCDWQDDDIDVNFELHSHFIEQLLAMLWSLGQVVDTPVVQLVKGHFGVENKTTKQQDVLTFVARNLPNLIELIGKMRGLSTYCAASGQVSDVHAKKMAFLLQCVREESASLRVQALELDKTVAGVLTALTGFKEIDLKLNYFVNCVERDLLGTNLSHADIEEADSNIFFRLATELIDLNWVIVNQGLSLLKQWQGEDIEQWLSRG